MAAPAASADAATATATVVSLWRIARTAWPLFGDVEPPVDASPIKRCKRRILARLLIREPFARASCSARKEMH
jgi:hypothetical protein